MVLQEVTRGHSGVYECNSFDTETYESISGNTTVFVNCKESAPIDFVTVTDTFYCSACSRLSSPLLLCVDLDPAVVEPKEPAVVDQGEELKATCNALSSLRTHTVWIKVWIYRCNVQSIRG